MSIIQHFYVMSQQECPTVALWIWLIAEVLTIVLCVGAIVYCTQDFVCYHVNSGVIVVLGAIIVALIAILIATVYNLYQRECSQCTWWKGYPPATDLPAVRP